MQDYSVQIADCLRLFRAGERSDAFHGLLEADDAVVPLLMDVFDTEKDLQVKDLLLEVIWKHRQPNVIPFLAKALSSSEPIIWRQALDGLVALASPESLDVLQNAKTNKDAHGDSSDEFEGWLDEAIEQVEKLLQNSKRN